MKRMKAFILIIFFTVILQSQITAREIYPGKTISFEPSFFSGLIFSGGGKSYIGLDLNNIFKNVNFGITSGYNFLQTPESSLVLYGDAGIRGGYSFYFFNLLGIQPNAGISLLFTQNIPVFAVTAGLNAEMHLYNRNFLMVAASLTFPFQAEITPSFFFGIGIKKSFPILIDVPPVSLSLESTPELFSPDGDGENDLMEIRMDISNENSVRRWNFSVYDNRSSLIYCRAGVEIPPKSITWNGLTYRNKPLTSAVDYRLVFELEDILRSRFIEERKFLTDILVEEINGKYIISIDSIIFPPNSADFSLLSTEEQQKNNLIIRKLAVKLEKFADYHIRIEGHGILTDWQSEEKAEIEQQESLIPLTEERAEIIKEALVAYGISEARLSILGMGGSSPVVPFSDKENRWKNRRVEFILLK